MRWLIMELLKTANYCNVYYPGQSYLPHQCHNFHFCHLHLEWMCHMCHTYFELQYVNVDQRLLPPSFHPLTVVWGIYAVCKLDMPMRCITHWKSLVYTVWSLLGHFLLAVSLVVSLKQALIIGPNRTNENALCQIKRELQSQPPNRSERKH